MSLTKKQTLYLILCGIFLTSAIIAEIIGAKIFSAEATFGFKPAQLNIFGYMLDFNMTAGVLNWPVVFVTSDIINEYFGTKGVKRISYLTAALIAYSFILIYLATSLVPAAFWLDVNSVDSNGKALDINEAFKMIFRQGLGIITGSLTAFLIGQVLDAYIFHRLRNITKNKYVWLRATGSTLVSQMIDSFVVIFIAFFVFGNWKLDQVFAVGTVNYIYKFFVAILMTPVIYLAHYLIDKYLGKEHSHKMIEDATFTPF
jgi:uncharacterized integral membrane protein (TIGR00697 family)